MKLFFKYLKGKKAETAAFVSFAVIFVVCFILYGVPAGAVLYPAALCLLAGAMICGADFANTLRLHNRLCRLKKQTAAMIGELPSGRTVTEEDLAEIAENLIKEVRMLESVSEERLRDMTEYYTVGVHHIKTPIASMKLTLQNEDSPLSRKLSADLFRIEQYAEMVLTYLRLDSSSGDYVFREQELDGIIKNSVKKFASEFIGRKISLDYEKTEKKLVTDEKWLGFVVEQILSNSLKYTQEGGSIRIYMKTPDVLCIEDTGIGIAPEDMPRIFEKGYTGYNGRIDRRASGIGLYLCKRICENLGAEISAESEPEKGTAVLIKLDQYKIQKD